LILKQFIQLILKLIIDLKYILCIFALLFLLSIPSFGLFYDENFIDLTPFIKYVTDCKNFIKYNREAIINDHPYISVCISAKNMQDYIEKNLLSILNQSFQNFEIIIVNDGSDDETENIIHRIQSTDKRIKLLTHSKNKGVYRSRVEAIYNSNSEYTLIMDPDDMYLNENLFQELYNYNLQYNLDIIEFSVMHQIEGEEYILSKITYCKSLP
jgi:cellulose synthase/poly-beta-1,6-N-acetylglucosamine synthase-like glycosyltransferase